MLRKKDAAALDPRSDDAKNSLIAFFVRGAIEDKQRCAPTSIALGRIARPRDRSQSLNS
jgi:hypothetical protein